MTILHCFERRIHRSIRACSSIMAYLEFIRDLINELAFITQRRLAMACDRKDAPKSPRSIAPPASKSRTFNFCLLVQ